MSWYECMYSCTSSGVQGYLNVVKDYLDDKNVNRYTLAIVAGCLLALLILRVCMRNGLFTRLIIEKQVDLGPFLGLYCTHVVSYLESEDIVLQAFLEPLPLALLSLRLCFRPIFAVGVVWNALQLNGRFFMWILRLCELMDSFSCEVALTFSAI